MTGGRKAQVPLYPKGSDGKNCIGPEYRHHVFDHLAAFPRFPVNPVNCIITEAIMSFCLSGLDSPIQPSGMAGTESVVTGDVIARYFWLEKSCLSYHHVHSPVC